MVVSDLSEIRGTACDVVAVVAPLTQPSAAEQAEFTSLFLVWNQINLKLFAVAIVWALRAVVAPFTVHINLSACE